MNEPPPLRPPRDHRVEVPLGNCSFELEIGGVRLRLADLPTGWDPFVHEAYFPFAEQAGCGPAPQLTIRCRESQGQIVPFPPPGEMTVLEIERIGAARYAIRSHWQDGWIDLTQGEGELVLTNRATDCFSLSVENFLRVAFQLLLIDRERFLMHTAALIDHGRVFLFFGPSGAGKSTATAFSEPRPALSDDMVLIDVSGPRPLAWAVPFFMAFAPEKRTRGAWPIAAGLRLRQSPDDRLERLSPARSVATVSASIPFIHELGLFHTGLTELATRMCRDVPVSDLYFTKSARFWEILTREFPQP